MNILWHHPHFEWRHGRPNPRTVPVHCGCKKKKRKKEQKRASKKDQKRAKKRRDIVLVTKCKIQKEE